MTATPVDRLGPLLSQELLEELDALWPNQCPSPHDPDLVIKCAQRQVIDVLWTRFRRFNTTKVS